MPSSTSLYSSTPGNANVASSNFTTLYSGSGTINPTQAYGNANVVSLLAVGTDGGNTIGNISATGNVTADYFIGNFQGNITGNINVTGANTEVLFNNAGNVGTAAGFTFVNTTGNLAVPGNVSAVGNVAASYFLGNGSQLTGLPATYSNANVTSLLASFGSNVVSTTGNVTAGYFIGNGSQLTGLAATYSNANVVSLLAAFGSNTISTTGNVTAGYFVGNGSALTSIAGANVTGVVANATYALNANASTFAGTVTTAAQPNITSVGILTAINTSGNVSATGNITGNYFLGNGSQLTGLPATYGNANVAANLAAFATNPISTSGNITASYFFGNGSGLTDINAGNIVGAYGNANVANFLGNGFGSNTITTTGNITTGNLLTGGVVSATGNIDGGNLRTAGVVTATGNIDGGNLRTAGVVTATGNVSGGNVIVPINGRYYGDFTTATASGRTLFQTTATGTTAGTNITVIPGINHTTSNTAFNSSYNLFASTDVGNSAIGALRQFGNLTTLVGTNTGTATASNIRIQTSSAQINLLNTGNVGIGNTAPQHGLAVSGTVWVGSSLTATGNVISDLNLITPTLLANTIYDNGAGAIAMISSNVSVQGNLNISKDFVANTMTALTFISSPSLFTSDLTPPGGGPLTTTSTLSTIIGNLSVTGTIIGTGNITGGNINTGGIVTATGNITGANLVATANLTSTQQTVVGTANIAGGTGNIIISGKNIATDMAFAPDGGNAINAALSRVVVGTGWVGNITHSVIQNRLLVQDTFARGNTGTAVQLMASDPIVSLTANVTNGSFRVQGVGSRVRIGGGSAGNTMNLVSPGAGSVGAISALQPNIDVGNVTPYLLGNTLVSHATLNGGFFTIHSGGAIGNAYGMLPGMTRSANGLAVTGNTTNYLGFTNNLNNAGNVTGNLYAFYHGNNSSSSSTGISVNDTARAATNYYAFKNDDNVAQVQLGSLRSYNEFQYPTATSGTVNIDKLNAQVQYIAPTANVTIGDLQNFVTNANDSVNNDAQTDTVTLIIKQGATPYTVTMPTGNAAIKYAGGVTTVGSTANAVTMISITGANVAGAALYLVTVSPEFS